MIKLGFAQKELLITKLPTINQQIIFSLKKNKLLKINNKECFLGQFFELRTAVIIGCLYEYKFK